MQCWSVRFGCLRLSSTAFPPERRANLSRRPHSDPSPSAAAEVAAPACCCCSDSCNLVMDLRGDVSGNSDALCVSCAAAARTHASAQLCRRTALDPRRRWKYWVHTVPYFIIIYWGYLVVVTSSSFHPGRRRQKGLLCQSFIGVGSPTEQADVDMFTLSQDASAMV